MELILSYSTKVHSDCSAMNTMFRQTAEQYTAMLSWMADVCRKEIHLIRGASQNDVVNRIEALIHATSRHPIPKYDFDTRFLGCPSYLRRELIASASGKVKSWDTNCRNWEEQGKHGKEPAFPTFGFEMPCFYYGNMFCFTDRHGNKLDGKELSTFAQIKVFCSQRQLTQDHALTKKQRKSFARRKIDMSSMVWDWMNIRLKTSDVRYLQKRVDDGCEICAPVLMRKGHSFSLCFAVKNNTSLSDKAVKDRIILAVDLGINTPATCCVMRSDGTILARRFYQNARDMGCLNHRLALVSKAQSKGSRKTPVLWRMVDNANRKLSDGTADFIIAVAEEFSVDVIVFEHLDIGGKKRGRKKQRLHHWRAKYVQELVSNRAHARGMRIARVCAWNTSKLAFDGSGCATRGINGNYSVCMFKTGKVYNCDLSACYNIGARYFIREIMKTRPVTVWSELKAKVPELALRSTCTLSTLIKLNTVLPSLESRMPDGAEGKPSVA